MSFGTYTRQDEAQSEWERLVQESFKQVHLSQYDSSDDNDEGLIIPTTYESAKTVPVSEYEQSSHVPSAAGIYPWSPDEMTNQPCSIYTIPTGPDLFYLTHSCPDLTSTHPSDFQYSTSLSPTVSIASSDSSTRGISPILSAMPGRKEPWSLSHQSTMDNGSVYDPVTLTPLSSRYNDDDRSVLSAASSRDYTSGSESPSPTGSIYNGHAYSSSQVSFDDFIGNDGRCISPTERENTQALRDFYGTIPDTNIDFYPNIDSPGEHERSRRSSWASSHGTRNSVRSLASSLRDKTSSRSETTGRSSSVPPSSSARGFSSSWRR